MKPHNYLIITTFLLAACSHNAPITPKPAPSPTPKALPTRSVHVAPSPTARPSSRPLPSAIPSPQPTASPGATIGGAKQSPRGIYVVLTVNDPKLDTEACWTDPNVKGVLLRTNWSTVEPQQGSFDWSYIDAGLALCQKNGKLAQLSVDAGLNSPAWVYALPAAKWTGEKGTQPAPWDANAMKAWATFVAAFGERYDSNPLVTSVTLWAGGYSIECMFAQHSADAKQLDALGGVSLWIGAAKASIDAFNAAFPTTQLYLATGMDYPDQFVSMTQLAQYALSKGLGLQSNALSPRYPGTDGLFPHTTMAISTIPKIGYQLLYPTTSTRQGGTVAQTLANAQGAQWVQLYPGDPATDEASCAAFNASH